MAHGKRRTRQTDDKEGEGIATESANQSTDMELEDGAEGGNNDGNLFLVEGDQRNADSGAVMEKNINLTLNEEEKNEDINPVEQTNEMKMEAGMGTEPNKMEIPNDIVVDQKGNREPFSPTTASQESQESITLPPPSPQKKKKATKTIGEITQDTWKDRFNKDRNSVARPVLVAMTGDNKMIPLAVFDGNMDVTFGRTAAKVDIVIPTNDTTKYGVSGNAFRAIWDGITLRISCTSNMYGFQYKHADTAATKVLPNESIEMQDGSYIIFPKLLLKVCNLELYKEMRIKQEELNRESNKLIKVLEQISTTLGTIATEIDDIMDEVEEASDLKELQQIERALWKHMVDKLPLPKGYKLVEDKPQTQAAREQKDAMRNTNTMHGGRAMTAQGRGRGRTTLSEGGRGHGRGRFGAGMKRQFEAIAANVVAWNGDTKHGNGTLRTLITGELLHAVASSFQPVLHVPPHVGQSVLVGHTMKPAREGDYPVARNVTLN